MKNIQLKKLELTNYRNIQHAEYEFDGNSKIIGENRIGKTNTLEAIYFLLTDKLLDGSSDLPQIKTLKDTKLEVRVKGYFDIDGKEITIEKQYGEKWVKTRGSATMEFKGHYTNYIYNDFEQPTYKEYYRLFCEDFGLIDSNSKIDYAQMLVNPFYIGNLGESSDWTHLRAFIIKLVGDVSDEDVVNRNPAFKTIVEDIKKANGRIDQVKKSYTGLITNVKEQIISDDAQIKMLEETTRPTDDEISVAKEGIALHETNISNLKANVGVDTASVMLQEKINKKRAEVNKLKAEDIKKSEDNTVRNELQNQLNSLYEEQSKLIAERSKKVMLKKELEFELETVKKSIQEKTDLRLKLINELKDIDSKLENPEANIITECPTCHRRYDDKEIAERTELVVEELKARYQKIIADGKQNSAQKQELELKVVDINNKINDIDREIANIQEKQEQSTTKIKELNEKISSTKTTVVENPQIAVLTNEIADLEQQLKESKENFAKGITNNNELILEEQKAIEPLKKVIDDYAYYVRQQEKVVEVRKAKEKHTDDLSDLEQKKELLNQFVYTKLKMLDENVSKVFGNIKFQLIKENIKEGSFDAVCKPYIFNIDKNESTDTTWKSGSKSERVITGIAIAEKIKVALGLPNLPYLFDEGGEISSDTFATKLLTDSQLICVKVVDNVNNPLVQPIK